MRKEVIQYKYKPVGFKFCVLEGGYGNCMHNFALTLSM